MTLAFAPVAPNINSADGFNTVTYKWLRLGLGKDISKQAKKWFIGRGMGGGQELETIGKVLYSHVYIAWVISSNIFVNFWEKVKNPWDGWVVEVPCLGQSPKKHFFSRDYSLSEYGGYLP